MTWARRIRELRVEHGYDIEYLDGFYYLQKPEPDAERATSWQIANSIRRRKDSARSKIDAFLTANVGTVVRVTRLTMWPTQSRQVHGGFASYENRDGRSTPTSTSLHCG